MRFEVNKWALFAAPASDWLRRGYLPDRLPVIGPRETMACVNSPRALARLTRTLFSLSARSLLRLPPLGLVRDHTRARSLVRFELELHEAGGGNLPQNPPD